MSARAAEGGEEPLVFVTAGEPSGDAIGARLMAALRARGAVRFAGVGGPRMEEEGLASLFPMSDLAVMGAAEVLPRARRLLRRIGETVAAIRAARPAAVVTIDSPGFSFRVQRRLAAGSARRIHYVAPTVWAWRAGRAAKVARFLDRMLCLLPFEPPYFEAAGLAASFVGHPVMEEGADRGDGPAFRRRHGLAADRPILAVLLGSRRSEVRALLPVFAETVRQVAARVPGLAIVVPTVPTVAEAVRAASWPVPAVVVEGAGEKYDAFAAATAALAASGTVSLELGLAGCPAVIAYRVHPATALWVRALIKVRYATLANILLDRPVVPEFLQARCRPALLAPAVAALLGDEAARGRQLAEVREALRRLAMPGMRPSQRAAEAVFDEIALGGRGEGRRGGRG